MYIRLRRLSGRSAAFHLAILGVPCSRFCLRRRRSLTEVGAHLARHAHVLNLSGHAPPLPRGGMLNDGHRPAGFAGFDPQQLSRSFRIPSSAADGSAIGLRSSIAFGLYRRPSPREPDDFGDPPDVSAVAPSAIISKLARFLGRLSYACTR